MKKDIENSKNDSKEEQKKIENMIQQIFDKYNYTTGLQFEEDFEIFRDNHLKFVNRHISGLSGGYKSIDSGLPWFAYWSLNIFYIFGMNSYEMSKEIKDQFILYLKDLQHPDGGFCGYAKGNQHIISNYAAILAIVVLDCKEAYDIVDRKAMKKFLMSMKNTNFNNDNTLRDRNGTFLVTKPSKDCSEYKFNFPNSFEAHKNGENDLRTIYCSLIAAYVLNLIDDQFLEGIVGNISACQTFEGGLGPEPFSEAHGGYNFCGMAVLILLNSLDSIDIERELRWLVNRQMKVEGGFQGRTNKLVDSCYSFWQGAVFNMLIMHDKERFSYDAEMLYDQLAVQAYIGMACQIEKGGIVDKPGKGPDLFHTNYAGSGYALSQRTTNDEILLNLSYHESTELTLMNPIFCVPQSKLNRALKYFKSMSVI